MAQTRQQVYRRYRDDDNDREVVTTEVTDQSPDAPALRLQNIVMIFLSAIGGLLVIRFLLSLFAANPNNIFADFIYDLTNPLVSPFRGLFGIDTTLDETGSTMEIETLTAIVVYYLIGWLIIRFIDAGRKNPPEVEA